MVSLILHLIVPMFFYSGVTSFLFLGLKLDALAATGFAAAVCAPLFYTIYRRDQRERGIGKAIRLSLHGCFFHILVMGWALCVCGNEIIALLGLAHSSQTYEEVRHALYAPPVPVQILASGFLIPVTEELMFRGLGFLTLRDRLSFWPSAVLSSALFGIYHGNLPQGVYAFLIGMAVAWLCEVSKTLLAPCLLHMSANLLSLLVTNTVFAGRLFESEKKTVMAAFALLSFALAVACAVRINSKNKLKEDMV
ncbi:CPBP family intramembrane glutamic endopeptidase [Lacrimispora sp. JR3]|uniref:CPBP family intramembrane glutamic endopeptidase n=1 Tax=Lacrimispora sinapis TaxID=3111456 RepID=UPI003747B2C2